MSRKTNQLAVRRRKGAAFKKAHRDEIVRLLETGTARSVTHAAEMICVKPHVVHKWMTLGARTLAEWRRLDGMVDGELRHAEHVAHRAFYMRVQQAMARAGAIVDVVMTEAALGRQVERVDPSTGETYIAREGADWRAADALGKRQERMDLHYDKKRLTRAQADKETFAVEAARELARRAKADADRAELLAEATRRASKEQIASVVFTPTFLAALEAKQPELARELAKFMDATGYSVATPEQATQAANERDEERDKALNRMAIDWGMEGLPPTDPEPPVEPS